MAVAGCGPSIEAVIWFGAAAGTSRNVGSTDTGPWRGCRLWLMLDGSGAVPIRATITATGDIRNDVDLMGR